MFALCSGSRAAPGGGAAISFVVPQLPQVPNVARPGALRGNSGLPWAPPMFGAASGRGKPAAPQPSQLWGARKKPVCDFGVFGAEEEPCPLRKQETQHANVGPSASEEARGKKSMRLTLAGLELAIFGSEDQRFIHSATGP